MNALTGSLCDVVVEDHEITITKAEVVLLWERAFSSTYPKDMNITKGLEAVMLEYGVHGVMEQLRCE